LKPGLCLMLASVQFVTRPFVVGDRIELKTTGGGSVLVGIVEKITPMRTVLRTDGTIPMAIPNK
jgi:small-conductance mechanosensitive channel